MKRSQNILYADTAVDSRLWSSFGLLVGAGQRCTEREREGERERVPAVSF